MNFISIKTLKRKGNVHTHTKSACSNRHSWSYSIQFLPQGSGWKVSSYNKHLGSPFVTGYICMFTCTCVYFALVLLSGNRAGSLQTEETNESQYHRARKRESTQGWSFVALPQFLGLYSPHFLPTQKTDTRYSSLGSIRKKLKFKHKSRLPGSPPWWMTLATKYRFPHCPKVEHSYELFTSWNCEKWRSNH